MIAKKLTLLFLLILCLGSCRRNLPLIPPSEQPDYLIFGHFYGFCLGKECIEIFKIEDGKVFEDTLDNYPSWRNSNTFAFIPLSNEKYQQVKGLSDKIPTQLFEEEDAVLGTPDAADGGGFYVETNISGEVRFWLIDKMESNIPSYLHNFTTAMEEAINKLSSD